MRHALLIFLLLALAPAHSDEGRIYVDKPILIIYAQPGEKDLKISATPPEGYTIDHYALLIIGAVRFLAAGYKVPQEELWSAIERNRMALEIGQHLQDATSPRR